MSSCSRQSVPVFVVVAYFATGTSAAGTEAAGKIADSKTHNVTIERAEGKYPEILRRFNVEGDGLVRTTVTHEGQLTDIKVTQSPHPAFEYAMVQVLLASKFTPAMKEGVPIQQGVVLPFRFRFEGSGKRELSRYDAPFAFPSKASPDLPAALQYDVPPGMKVVAPVVYPRHLFEHGSFGRARGIQG